MGEPTEGRRFGGKKWTIPSAASESLWHTTSFVVAVHFDVGRIGSTSLIRRGLVVRRS